MKKVLFGGLSVIILSLALVIPQARATSSIVYDALPSVSPDTSYPSQPFQAQQTAEFGDSIHLGGTDRVLQNVTVTMVTWAKFSDYSSNPTYMNNSVNWTHPITLNIYSTHLGANGAPDQLLGTVTQNITIPWRPEGDPSCPDTGYGVGFAWKDTGGTCRNGLAFNATFDMSSLNVTLPDDIIVGVAYNTQTYGTSPIGVDGPYNSLNVAVPPSQPVTVGSDDNADQVFWDTHTCSYYTDSASKTTCTGGNYGLYLDTNWTPNGTVALQIQASTPAPSPSVTTDAATNLGSTTATVNGTNGPVNADNTSFWWGTTPIVGTLTSGTDPGSSEFPASNWTHDNGEGAFSATAPFSENLTGLTPNTEYYFVAWIHDSGTNMWYPGQVLNFTTSSAPNVTVTTNSATGITTTSATVNGTDGSIAGDNTSFWLGTTAPVGSIVAGVDPGSSELPSGWTHDNGLGTVLANGSFSNNLTGLASGTTYYFIAWVQTGGIWYPGQVLSFITPVLPASCPANTTQSTSPVDTVVVNSSSSTSTPGNVSLVNGSSYLVVSSGTWQNSNLNVADTAYTSTNNWTTYMEGYDISPYFLGPKEFQLQVNNNFVNWGAYDGTNHTYSYAYTGTGAPISLGVFDGDSNTGVANSGWYGDNSGNLTVKVYFCNPTVTPPTTTTISGEKFNDKNRDGKLDNGEQGLKGWTINLEDVHNHVIATAVTDANGDYSFTNVAPGVYKVREVHQNGWDRMTKNPKAFVVTAGSANVTDVDFGNAALRKGDKQDNNNDDQRDDQSGYYYCNHGKSDYSKDQDNKDHQQTDNNNKGNNKNH